MRWQWYITFALVAFTVSSPDVPIAAQGQQPPRVVAFVIGVERYAQPNLNGLRYVGEDAFRLWNALKAISTFDEARSRIFVADRERKGSLPAAEAFKEELTRDFITTELERFLDRTRRGDTVVIYFGGHGKVRYQRFGVSFLPSNFSDANETFVNAILMRRVIEDAEARTAGKQVSVVVLANMCHAGAAGVYDPDQRPSKEQMSEAAEIDASGTKRFAYIPAAGAETTYERDDLGGSRFLRHLDVALKGAGADDHGRVTSELLLRTLQQAIPEIPRIGAFDGSIVIGRTGRQQAAYRRAAGIALLAAALDEGNQRQLLTLAAKQFERAADSVATRTPRESSLARGSAAPARQRSGWSSDARRRRARCGGQRRRRNREACGGAA